MIRFPVHRVLQSQVHLRQRLPSVAISPAATRSHCSVNSLAWAAASRAIGTRCGEQDT